MAQGFHVIFELFDMIIIWPFGTPKKWLFGGLLISFLLPFLISTTKMCANYREINAQAKKASNIYF